MGSGETVRKIEVTHIPTETHHQVYVISSGDRIELSNMGLSRRQLLLALEVDEQEVRELNTGV